MTEQKTQEVIEQLNVSYNMEIETVANYIANSYWLDGMQAKHIKDSLAEDIEEEVQHAQRLANRIKTLGGRIIGSQELKMNQDGMQPPQDSLDIMSVIDGVIAAEQGAIDQYQKIIEMTGDADPVTEDLAIELKGEEEEHRRLFMGFKKEAESMMTSNV